MTPEEVREYTKNSQKAEDTKNSQKAKDTTRVLGPLNDWYMGKCIRKIDRSIKNEAEGGRKDIGIYFSDLLFHLYDADKKYLAEHYSNQGYHVNIRAYTIRIGWSVGKPWWAY